jgi:hypothetical protein
MCVNHYEIKPPPYKKFTKKNDVYVLMTVK